MDEIKAGHWEAAHQLIQAHSDPFASLIHAYLHREEGDLDNAAYWYARANKPMPAGSLADELDCLYRMAQNETLD
ncbi:hypothetical protein [Methylomicrobium lacus]|uniref:hypothetical protein n=1 Tax=Methylomicrobium lacus TaxID=136992 RepID=UPI0035A8DD5C